MRLLVYEYMPDRDLATALKFCRQTWEAKDNCSSTMQIDYVNPSITPTLLSWFTRLKLATQVAEALSFLHHSCQPPITHRDLKASSILLTSSFNARLSSFNEAHTLTKGELPLYDIHCYGRLLLHLIFGSNVIDGIHMKEFFDSKGNLNGPPYDLSNDSTFFQLLDPSMMVQKDCVKQILGVAFLAKRCVEVRASTSISMFTVAKLLRDPVGFLKNF
ncbi:hypothetical protein L7F22_050547 [Adiantum nelumboides]|nr:hypothetical protein [Adiantum nelumboides]